VFEIPTWEDKKRGKQENDGLSDKSALFAMRSTSACNPSQDDHNLADYLCVASTLMRFRS
jgi:hypothetical protein